MNIIRNLYVTISDIVIAEDILGKDIGALKGNKVYKITTQAKMDSVEVPKWLIKLHNKLFIAVDVIFKKKTFFGQCVK